MHLNVITMFLKIDISYLLINSKNSWHSKSINLQQISIN